jgi:hypothetical protein
VSQYRFECVSKTTGEIWFQGVSCTRQRPCPVCRKPTAKAIGYCVADYQRGLVWCGHCPQRGRDAFFRLDGQHCPPPATVQFKERPAVDFAPMHEEMRNRITPKNLRAESDALGVHPESLAAVGIGWCDEYDAATFPMYGLNRKVVGIRVRRRRDGKKWAVPGSTNGVFIPQCTWANPDQNGKGRCFVVEGPTDTAAGVDLGLSIFGLPAALVAHQVIAHYVRGREVVIIRDGDEAGIKSSDRLSEILIPICPSVHVIRPMIVKDLRAWLRAGATPGLIESVITNTSPRRPKKGGVP